MIIFNKNKVNYFLDKNEKLHFRYQDYYDLEKDETAILQLKEAIPDEIKGRENIDLYVKEKVESYLKERLEKINEQRKFEQSPDFSVEVKYKNILLRGKIIRASCRGLTVRLEEPFPEEKGERNINYGWASAMAGHYVFKGHCQFSEDAIETAKNLLKLIYKEIIEKRKLEKRLNGDEN